MADALGARSWRRPTATSALVLVMATSAALWTNSVSWASSPKIALQSISVSPVRVTIAVGEKRLFKVTGHFSNGTERRLTNAKWTTSDTSVATVSSASTSNGVATAIGAGSTSIEAAYKGKTADATIDVNQGRVFFSSSGSFTVPSGVTSINVAVTGGSAAGSLLGGGEGGAGAVVHTRITISQYPLVLQVVVGYGGNAGSNTSAGGGGYSAFGSGGDGGGDGAGGGGGASGVFVGAPDAADALVVAGGGGGESPYTINYPSGNGGTLSPGGNGAGLNGGFGATQTGPGAGGAPGYPYAGSGVDTPCSTPSAGVGPSGGNGGGFYYSGGSNGVISGGGGGGGGGWFGGGGAGCTGVGGGGSSYVAPSEVGGAEARYRSSNLISSRSTNGLVVISWG